MDWKSSRTSYLMSDFGYRIEKQYINSKAKYHGFTPGGIKLISDSDLDTVKDVLEIHAQEND